MEVNVPRKQHVKLSRALIITFIPFDVSILESSHQISSLFMNRLVGILHHFPQASITPIFFGEHDKSTQAKGYRQSSKTSHDKALTLTHKV